MMRLLEELCAAILLAALVVGGAYMWLMHMDRARNSVLVVGAVHGE